MARIIRMGFHFFSLFILVYSPIRPVVTNSFCPFEPYGHSDRFPYIIMNLGYVESLNED